MPTVAKGMAGVAARPTVEIAPGATTILVVDDIESNRDYLVTLLRHHGYRLVQAVDGRDGLAIVKAEHPDLVISDVLMPVMDGYEFVRQLRLDPETSRIPVVFYTAHYGEREAQSLAMSSGVAHVLTKPVTSSEVLEVVSRVLSAKADAGSLPQVSPLSNEFDQKHVRLLTDKLSEKVSDLITANSQLRSLINIEVELASDQDSTRRIEKVCESARDLFGATYVTIGILDRTNGTLLRLVSCGADTSSWIESGGCARHPWTRRRRAPNLSRQQSRWRPGTTGTSEPPSECSGLPHRPSRNGVTCIWMDLSGRQRGERLHGG